MEPDRLDLISPMARDVCVQRLKAGLDSPWVLFGRNPIIGRVDETRFRAHKRIGYRNGFQTYLSAELSDHNGGTKFRCRFSLSLATRIYVMVWGGALLLIGGPIFLWSLYLLVSKHPGASWFGLIIPPGLMIFFGGLVVLGRYLARHERQFLIDHLRETVGAWDT